MVICISNYHNGIRTTWWCISYKTGSEDGCGSSWPLCHGALLPQNLPIDTIIELSHRAVSGLSLIVVLWLAISMETYWLY